MPERALLKAYWEHLMVSERGAPDIRRSSLKNSSSDEAPFKKQYNQGIAPQILADLSIVNMPVFMFEFCAIFLMCMDLV